MARVVHVDYSDELVKITVTEDDIEFHVHKHLLCERSNLLKSLVEETTPREPKNTIHWGDYAMDRHTASIYIGFLYGQPMWIYSADEHVDSAFVSLGEIHEMSMRYEDYDAADACLDGMRELLENHRDSMSVPFSLIDHWMDFDVAYGRLLVDYMVHKEGQFQKWLTAHNRAPWASGDLHRALSKVFAEEAQRRDDRLEEPDLMARCRYHLHVEKGLPCYLDK